MSRNEDKLDEKTILLYVQWIFNECNTPIDEVEYLISIIQDKTLSYVGRMKLLKENINWTLEELAEVNQ